jgi:hypothetical protein
MKPLEKMYLDECDAITYADVMANMGDMNKQPAVNQPEYTKPGAVNKAIVGGLEHLKSDVESKPLESVYGGVKGAAEGFVGLPGDIISLIRGVASAIQTPEGKSKIESFISGTEGKTGLPTTQDVKSFLDTLIPPTTATGAEFAGELLSPGGYIKAGKDVVKAAKTLKAK